ncbi:Small-conductance mechanosensitive channel [Parelusimicrobium proximum]|uniref:mechanosensitive ion channel family protein n=1 Tax=Parelusimicrobium proximum TaxID=3228953 RepID=UPI003D16EAB4
MKRFVLSLVFALFTFPLFAAADTAEVAPFGYKLFDIYGGVGAVDAEARAEMINENILRMSKDPLFLPSAVSVVKGDDSHNIMYGGRVVAGFTDKQADAEGRSRGEIAADYRNKIIEAVEKEQALLREEGKAKSYILGAAVFIIMVFIMWGTNRAYKKTRNFILERHVKKNKVIDDIIDVSTQNNIILTLLNVLRYVLLAAILYAGSLVILELLPQTRHFASALIRSLIVPVHKGAAAFYHYIPDLLDIIFIAAVFWLLLKMLRRLALKAADGKVKIPGFHADWAVPTYQIIRVCAVVFAFILIFPHLPGSESAAFKGVSVFIGVLLSLGSTSLISNIMSGLVITYMRPFKVGDYIKMGDVTGEVIERNTLITRIRTYKNEVVTIPNSKIMTSDSINYSNSASKYGLIIHFDITIGYCEDWRRVHALLIEAAEGTDGISAEPKPFVLQTQFDNFAVRYQLNAYTKNPERLPKIYSALYGSVQDVFGKAGIELLTPEVNVIRSEK